MSSRATPPPPPPVLSFLIHFLTSGGGGGVGASPLLNIPFCISKFTIGLKNPTNTHPTINLTIIPTNCKNVQWIKEMIIEGLLLACNKKVPKNTHLFTRTHFLLSLCLAWRLIVIQLTT